MSGDGTARKLGLGLGVDGGSWTPPRAEDLAEAIPGVRVRALAGRGGMGAVYRAEQVRLGRAVAVKVLPPETTADPLAKERFEREARVLAALNHPRVLRVFDFGTLGNGICYIVTEWAEGGDLAARMAGRAQEPRTVAAWVAQIAEALDLAHARGVVHRDLKPANVLVREDGGLALADFGVARAEGAGFTTALTLSGVVLGTADYLAPEQAEGRTTVTGAADVYALGVMTYQMLAGRTPRGIFEPVSKAARVPKAVDALIVRAMAAEPERRPRSAGEFARELERALAGGRSAGGPWIAATTFLIAAATAAVWAWRPVETGGERQQIPRTVATGEAHAVEAVAPGARAEEATRNLLAGFRSEEAARRGGWGMRGGGLESDGQACWIALGAEMSPDFRYEVTLEFTRKAGRNSVGVFLPTAAGAGVFELDAWDAGLGGWQMIDGRDLRRNGTAFSAALRNGERQTVKLTVDGTRVSAEWNGVRTGEVELAGRRFSKPEIWGAGDLAGVGLCSWQSPTVFHRVEFGSPGAGARD